jgi:hypothetical protein
MVGCSNIFINGVKKCRDNQCGWGKISKGIYSIPTVNIWWAPESIYYIEENANVVVVGTYIKFKISSGNSIDSYIGPIDILYLDWA